MAPSQKPTKRKKPATTATPSQPTLVPDTELTPDRREKIEKIKQALADGTYRISNEDVARKVIEHMRQPQPDPEPNS